MQRLFPILLFLPIGCVFGAAPAIGVATSPGSFQLDHARVSGNGTVFEGAAIETAEATSRVRLNGGAWIELASESRATIFAHRARLEAGFGEMQAGADFQVEARGLRISTGNAKTMARIRLDADVVLVAAVNGPVRVYTSGGLLVANVHPGVALSFRPGAGGADEFKISGCLLVKDKHYIVVDTAGSQTVEVRGDKLAGAVGNRVEVTGTAVATGKPVAGASQVIQVTKIDEIGRGGCVAAASSANASTRAAEASKSHTTAIIAGVAVAGAGGGVVAAVCCKGSKSSTSP